MAAEDPRVRQPLGGEYAIANRFLFKLDSLQVGVFKEVQGLQLTIAAESINEGGQNGFTHKVPGRIQWPNIVLRRGITESHALFDWLNRCSGEGFAGAGSTLARSDGSITALSSDGDWLRSWNLRGVWPVRWKGPDFSVDSGNVLEEELEITHHGFSASTPSAPA